MLAIARPAAAAERGFGVVTLDLRVQGADVPTHLCVVSEAESSRARRRLSELLIRTIPANATTTDVSWLVNPELWGSDHRSSLHDQCTDEVAGDCRPRVQLPRSLAQKTDLYVACTTDALSGGDAYEDPRPLFILLEYLEGSPPQVDSVRLAGGVATIGVFGAKFERVVVTARSLGGYYLPHRRSARGETDPGRIAISANEPGARTLRLDLSPRCQDIEVRLPRTTVSPSDRDRLSVRIHGMELNSARCVTHLTGREVFQIRLPPAPMNVGSVDVELAPTEDLAGARFSSSYEGAWPHSPLTLARNQVAFSWRRPECIYPHDRCPTATLETGTVCSATVTPTGCSYRCPGEVTEQNAIDLELPLEVTFERREPKQRWTDKLAQNGQQLTSYVDASQIYLEANINDWRTDIPGNGIERVAIFGEDGEARRYGVTRIDRLLLKVPGASCESVRFKPVGDRNYDEVVAVVDDGELDFGNPQRSARLVSFNVTLAIGGGPAWSGSIDTPPLYFSGLGMFGVQFRPRRIGWNRLGFEIRAGGTLGQWATTTTEATQQSSTDRQETRFGWARILFETGLMVSAHPRIAVGAGFGLGFSLPFRDEEQDLTSGNLNFIWTPSLETRFRLRRWLALTIQFRGVFGEQAFTRDGTAPVEGQRARSLLTLFGLTTTF